MPKKYDNLKETPEFEETPPSEKTPPEETPLEEAPEEKPDFSEQLSQISESLSKISERMDALEEKSVVPPIGTGETGEFTPDFEQGKYLPDDYKPQTYNEFVKKTIDIQRQVATIEDERITKQEQEWNNQWDEQLEEIAKKDPQYKVTDPSDKNDLGKKARAQLMVEAAQAGTPNLLGFYNATANYRKGTTKVPPSSRAPVGSGQKGGGGPAPGRAYEDMKKPVDQIMQEKYPELVS